MIEFYKVTVKRRLMDNYMDAQYPSIKGVVIAKIDDINLKTELALLVVDCNNDESEANKSLPEVENLTKQQAVKFAAKLQPQRKRSVRGAFGRPIKTIEISAIDLEQILKRINAA